MKTSFSALLAVLAATTILAWSVDYGDLVGSRAQRVAEIVRWVCIFTSYAMAAVALMRGWRVARGLSFYVLLLTGAVVPSVLSSQEYEQSLIAFARLFSFAPVALLALGSSEVGRSRVFAATFGGLLFLVLGSLPFMSLGDALANFGAITSGIERTRFAGLTTHPNNLAFFAVCVYALCIAVLFSQRRSYASSWSFWLSGLVGVLAVLACFATGSRTGMACIVCFPILLVALGYPLQTGALASRLRRLAIVLVAAVLICAPLYLAITGKDDGGRGGRSYDISNHSRLVAWRASLDAFRDNPFTGVGVGAGVDITGALERRLSYSHNVLLTWLRNSGLFAGVLALATVLLLTIRAGIAIESVRRNQSGYIATTTGALSLFAIVGFSAVDGALQGNYIFYFLAPLLFAFMVHEGAKAGRLGSGLQS